MSRRVLGPSKIPGFSYPGGKVRLRKWLVSHMPKEGSVYCEPFAGRGNVFWYAAMCLKYEKWWLNDLFTGRFLTLLREYDLGSIPAWLTPASILKMSHAASGNEDDLSIIMGPLVMFSGGVAHSGSAQQRGRNYKLPLYKSTLINCRRILLRTHATITSIDYSTILTDLADDKNAFIYLDPPYLDNDAGYAVDFDRDTHQQLLQCISSMQCRWMLSGYPSDLYTKYLGAPKDTRRTKVQMCSGGSSHARNTNKIECIWTNY